MILKGVLGWWPLDTFFWALIISWSWLLARVWSGPNSPCHHSCCHHSCCHHHTNTHKQTGSACRQDGPVFHAAGLSYLDANLTSQPASQVHGVQILAILVMIGMLDSPANDQGSHLSLSLSLSLSLCEAWDSSLEELKLTMVYAVCRWVVCFYALQLLPIGIGFNTTRLVMLGNEAPYLRSISIEQLWFLRARTFHRAARIPTYQNNFVPTMLIEAFRSI
jgi:hypothetical protein